MQKIKFFALFFTLMITAASAEEGWTPYYFPVIASMAPDYQGVPAETFSARDLLDEPAGSHGFCVVVGSHFYFTDGTRARFWGTNLVGDACFPDKGQAELLAERIAFFGFNAVRLTRIEQVTGSGQLDRLDQLIYQLKQRGIYVNINLGLDLMSVFDPPILAAQKEYAKAILSHLNPYTRLRYNQDPAICMVEINDEATLAGVEQSTLPEHYREVYARMREGWISDEGRGKLYENDYSIAGELRNWGMEKHSSAVMMKTLGEDEVTLYVSRTTDKPWHLQFVTSGVRLRKGQDYVFKFAARTAAGKRFKLSVEAQQHAPPWKNLGLDRKFEVGDEFAEYEARFTATDSISNAKIGFILGYQTGDVTVKNAVLDEDFGRLIARDFNAHLEKKYLKEMRDFLHGEAGVKVPVGVGGHADARQIAVQAAALDYVDRKAFWDRPVFPGEPGDRDNFRISDASVFSTQNGILGVFSAKSKEKVTLPRTLSAWSHCYPNRFAYETPLLLAQAADDKDWDAVFQYAFSHGGGDEKVYDRISGFYDTNANAQQLMLGAFGARIFLGSDEPKDKAAKLRFGITKNNAVIKFGKKTIRIGRIKNTDSGFDPDGTYSWGKAPTLLER